MKKVFLFLGLFLFFSSSVFGGTRTFTQAEGKDFEIDFFDIYGTDYTYPKQKITSLSRTSSSSGNSFNYIFTNDVLKSQQAIAYIENYVMYPRAIDLGTSQTNSVLLHKYQNSPFASNYQCNPQIISFENNQLKIQSNLEPFKVYSQHTGTWQLYPIDTSQLSQTDKNHFEKRMEDYYYMKTEIKAKLYRDDTIVKTKTKKVLIKPNINTFDYTLEKENLGAGNYYWKITATPIDLKCEDYVASEISDISPFTIKSTEEKIIERKETIKTEIKKEYLDLGKKDILVLKDDKKKKLGFTEGGAIIINGDDVTDEIVLDNITNKKTKIKNGVSQKENISKTDLVLTLHKVKKIKVQNQNLITNNERTEVKNDVNKIIEKINKAEITEKVSYNITENLTKYELKVENLSKNDTVWLIIPKDMAESLDDISIENKDGLIVKDMDPIIGYQFSN